MLTLQFTGGIGTNVSGYFILSPSLTEYYSKQLFQKERI